MITKPRSAPADYAAIAPHYESFTRNYEHERWMASLAELAGRHGLRHGTLLDVGCGTGKSLRPLLAMGFDGHGCDVSIEMLAQAAHRVPGVPLFQADMRCIGDVGQYAWVTCINDGINHLLDDDDLCSAMTSMAGALEPDGLLTFDVNTLMTHRWVFSTTFVVEDANAVMCWEGDGCELDRGQSASARVSIFARVAGAWERTVSRHRERWWSDQDIEEAASEAGLVIVGRYGQRRGAVLDNHVDERTHGKVVYFLRRERSRR